ncbi:RNA polymerase II associated protein 2 [Mortierella claussenii]|nr:RNA polymerase II associated protein 2 [Mortierella claussenii]
MAQRKVATMKDDIVVDQSPLVKQYLPPKPKTASSSSHASPGGVQAEQLTKKQILLQNNIAMHKKYESMVLDWTLTLADPVSEATLGEAANRIKQSHYQEIIDERNINRLCGYPLCTEPPRDLKGKFRISLSERKVFDITVLKKFCSSRCLSASRWFESQLTEDPLYLMDVDAEHLKICRVSIVPLGVKLAEFQAQRGQSKLSSDIKSPPAFSLPEHDLETVTRKPSQPSQPSSSSPQAPAPSLGYEYVQSLLASVPETPSFIKIVEHDTLGQAAHEPLDMSGMDQEMQEIFGDNEGNGDLEQQAYDVVDGFRVPVPSQEQGQRVGGASGTDMDTRTLITKMSQIELSGDRPSNPHDTAMRRTASSTSMDTQP